MRARGWIAPLLILTANAAADDPKPKPVDIAAFKSQLVVLSDAEGGLYAVQPGRDGRLFFAAGKGKAFYEQIVIGRSSDGTTGAWSHSVWAPRVPNIQPGSINKKEDGTYTRWCGGDEHAPLTEVGTEQSKAVLDKGKFMTTAMVRKPHLLARDDSAIYYYVDVIRDQYGGNGFRVFIGKKGAMKQRPLTDVARDTAGEIYSTKTGDLRIVREVDAHKSNIIWVKGEKRSSLSSLDLDANSRIIFKDLGIYTFTGSICENI